MIKLCCIFNYPPLYRESIYKKIDETFDTQFIWSEEVIDGVPSDIKKLDYSIFKRKPIINKNKLLFGKYLWVTGLLCLPFKEYDAFLVTETAYNSGFPFAILCRLLGKKVYGWGHGEKRVSKKFAPFFKLKYWLFTGFFSYGEKGRERLIEQGIPANKIHVIYNSLGGLVDPNERKQYSSDVLKIHFGNTFPTLLFVGRLTKVKQLDWLIKAISMHDNKGLNYNLLIVGDGEEKARLSNMAADAGVAERIWFYGECYDDSKLNILIYNSDLCVSPGNVGLTALHSMIYGTPVLSHDDFETQMPEYETIVPGETGDLYRYGSFEDFCKKIEEWLSHPINREQVKSNCYRKINSRWNSEYQIQVFKSVLK